MSFSFCLGPCYGCKRMFSFAPDLVPSIVVNGKREPVCRTCIEVANPKRIANGLEPIRILPGAYEPQPEGEI